ncbi:MspA family porin [Mycobacteroides abscessus]|uniref:MspA family porin n=1 Tax=Mycobacteroides abscessus TaxID=36809 RepID=UPI000D877FB6|nr:MspA family porin [Mycobacteroides abscessus]SPX88001.1 MspA protein [Mycobacteroides abscessus]
MPKPFAALTAICVLAAIAPLASADPEPAPLPAPVATNPPSPHDIPIPELESNAASALTAAPASLPEAESRPLPPVEGEPGPPPDNGIVASEPPTQITTPDGWILALAAEEETQLPIPPLTTAQSSREYLTGGTFIADIKGNGKTVLEGGTIEAGYQIGCGIELSSVRLTGNIGLSSSISPSGLGNISMPLVGNVEVRPRPGEVINVSVTKKKFKGKHPRITIKDMHIKIDGCVGQSFLRSYAVLTSSTSATQDIIAYYGVTKSV